MKETTQVHSMHDADVDNCERARVAFWQRRLEEGFRLLTDMTTYPLRECGEGLVSISDAARAAGVEMQFSTTKLAGRYDRIYFIREGLIDSLVAAGRDMNRRGWILKIEEGYRTREMQTQLARAPAVFDMIVRTCRRECGGEVPPLDLVARRAMCLVANWPLTGTHLFGAAVDVSVFERDNGGEVWRGAPYLMMSEVTPMDSPYVTAEAGQCRTEITETMARHGFVHYPGEFWHYNQGDALQQMMTGSGQPARYGPVEWDQQANHVTPFLDTHSPLTPLDTLQGELSAALKRLQES